MEQKYRHSQYFYSHSSFWFTETWIISSDPLVFAPAHCRLDQAVGVGTLPLSFLANPLCSPFTFSTCRKSPLLFTTAIAANHLTTVHLSSLISASISPSLSILHFSVASLLMIRLILFATGPVFVCPDALLQLSDLPKCSSFSLHAFIKLHSLFLSDLSLAEFTSFQLSASLYHHCSSGFNRLPLWRYRAVPFDSTDKYLMITPSGFGFFSFSGMELMGTILLCLID